MNDNIMSLSPLRHNTTTIQFGRKCATILDSTNENSNFNLHYIYLMTEVTSYVGYTDFILNMI